MCYNGKCMYFLEVETASLIFGILNVIFNALGSVGSLIGVAVVTMSTDTDVWHEREMGNDLMITGSMVLGFAATVALIIFSVGFLISLSFAIVLLVGLCKRKANLVKCYFVYGFMKIVFGCAAVFTVTFNTPDAVTAIPICAIVAGVYGLILWMIHHTYRKFQEEVPFTAFLNPISAMEKF